MGEDVLLPGAIETLRSAQKIGLKIALGSASKNARAILEKANVTSYFDAIVDGNDVINSKPDPEVFIKAANLLNLFPSECLVIEDSAKGIDAAIAGGFYALGIGQPEHLDHANKVVSDLTYISISEMINIH
jgi:beta-phosphoglucomutase